MPAGYSGGFSARLERVRFHVLCAVPDQPHVCCMGKEQELAVRFSVAKASILTTRVTGSMKHEFRIFSRGLFFTVMS